MSTLVQEDNIAIEALQRPSKTWIRKAFCTKSGKKFEVALGVVKGAQPGKVFTNIAGQHGMEHEGPIVLRDFFDEVNPALITGDLYVCPCANPLALELDFEFYPEEVSDEVLAGLKHGGPAEEKKYFGHTRRDDQGAYNMNRVWRSWEYSDEPPAGVIVEVAQWLWDTAIEPADMVIDHHGAQALKPYIYAEQPALPWTPVLGIEGIWCTGPMPEDATEYHRRMLSTQVNAAGKVGICVEYSVQHGIKEHERQIGRFALFNMMKALGMIEGAPEIPCDVWLVSSDGAPWWEEGYVELSAQHVGHPQFFVEEYERLTKGQTIVEVRSLQTNEILETITAPADSLMLHRLRSPLTTPGKKVCSVHTGARLLARAGEAFVTPML